MTAPRETAPAGAPEGVETVRTAQRLMSNYAAAVLDGQDGNLEAEERAEAALLAHIHALTARAEAAEREREKLRTLMVEEVDPFWAWARAKLGVKWLGRSMHRGVIAEYEALESARNEAVRNLRYAHHCYDDLARSRAAVEAECAALAAKVERAERVAQIVAGHRDDERDRHRATRELLAHVLNVPVNSEAYDEATDTLRAALPAPAPTMAGEP